MNGPFETAMQAQEHPAVRATYDAMAASAGPGVMAARNHRMLEEACSAAGVQIGAYDHRILLWLAGYEPQMCAVVTGLIGRAAAAGPATLRERCQRLQALEDAIRFRRARAAQSCGDCAGSDGRCDNHGRDIDLIGEFEQAARQLAAGS